MSKSQHDPYPRKPWLAALLGAGFGPLGFLYSSTILSILVTVLYLIFFGPYITSLTFKIVFSILLGVLAYLWTVWRPSLIGFPLVAGFDRPSWPKGLSVGALIALILLGYTTFIQTFVSTSGYPMAPTILSHERVIVNVLPSSRRNIQHGTVVLYNIQEIHRRAISRVVGLPGDLIEMRKGLLYVNGSVADDPVRISALRRVGCIDQKLEMNNSAFREKSGPVRVPQNSYYLLADNRSTNFYDSRSFGPVSASLIVGTIYPNKHDLSRIKPEDCQQSNP